MHQPMAEEARPSAPAPYGPAELALWQRSVLPVMVLVIVSASVYFAWAIAQEVRALYPRLEQAPASLAPHFETFERAWPEATGELDYLRFKALALLEADALQRRNQQASAAMISRVWTRQMGFMTGMLMALIGSAFILGRLEIRETRLSAEGQMPTTGGALAKAALATSSPGIVLATLGTLLMAMTIAIPGQISTSDNPVYLRSQVLLEATFGAAGPIDTLPPPLPEMPPLPGAAVGAAGPSSGGN